MTRRRMYMAVLATMLAALATQVARAQVFDLSWYTIDGGGHMFSTGGDFELGGTIGQADAGPQPPMTGGDFELTGGFWPGAAGGGGGGGCTGQETVKKAVCKAKKGAVKKLSVVVTRGKVGETLTAVLDTGQSLDSRVKSNGKAKFVFKGDNAPPCGDNAVTVCDQRQPFTCGC